MMIFVAVGTQKFQFDRLLKAVDDLCATSSEMGEVFAQIGYSKYNPKHFSYTRFLNGEEFNQKIMECDLLITHGGVSTIVTGLKNGKPIIVCPRLAQYGEHVDDHQIQLAKTFSQLNYVMMCENMQNLGKEIIESKSYPFRPFHSNRDQMYSVLEDYLDSIQKSLAND